MSLGSTASSALKFTIPHMPHIVSSFSITAFDHHVRVPKARINVWERRAVFEQDAVRIAEAASLDCQELRQPAIVHTNPEKLPVHLELHQSCSAISGRENEIVFKAVVFQHACHGPLPFHFDGTCL